MHKQETLNYEEQYKDALVAFSSFALANTGIDRTQTQLKIDSYVLSAIPWQFGMKRGVLAGSFTKEEIAFFLRFKNSLAGLALSVQRPDSREQLKIFCRCQLSALGMMKDRDNIGLVVLDWKPIPPDLVRILGDYLSLVERLKLEWGDFQNRAIQVTPESARRLGFNNYAVMNSGGLQHKLALFSIAANRLEFLMPLRSPDQRPGAEAAFSLYFLKYRFTVPGRIESSERLPTGVQRVKASLSFSPEFVHILEEYFSSQG